MANRWATKNESESLSGFDKKFLLIEKLRGRFDSNVHSLVDLSERDVSSLNGGLCGLAALHQAMVDTFKTKSQLRQMSYSDMVSFVWKEIGISGQKTSDKNLLLKFFACKYK